LPKITKRRTTRYVPVDYEYGDDDTNNNEDLLDGEGHIQGFKKDSNGRRSSLKHEAMAADCLLMRLLQVDDDDSDAEERILQESLDISLHRAGSGAGRKIIENMERASRQAARERLVTIHSDVLFTVVSLSSSTKTSLVVPFVGGSDT
jgi:hypothetical protein